VINEEVLQRVQKEKNILHTINRRKANWIGHILRGNCFIRHIISRKVRGKGTSGREDVEEDVSSNWMTLTNREDTIK
jgi:hypothetical protein